MEDRLNQSYRHLVRAAALADRMPLQRLRHYNDDIETTITLNGKMRLRGLKSYDWKPKCSLACHGIYTRDRAAKAIRSSTALFIMKALQNIATDRGVKR